MKNQKILLNVITIENLTGRFVVIGGLYLVEPMNPMKRKYRGEKVILVEVDGVPKVLRVESESNEPFAKRQEITFR